MAVEGGAEGAGVRRLDHDDKLALRIARMDFAAADGEDRSLDLCKPIRPRLHQHARDFGAGRRDHAVGFGDAPGDERAAVDDGFGKRHGSWPFQRAGGPGGPAIIW